MISEGKNTDFVFIDLVNKAMLPVDVPRPAAEQLVFERFGFFGAENGSLRTSLHDSISASPRQSY